MESEPRKNCIICGKEIYRAARKGQLKERRGKKGVTCSRPCAKIYNRVRCHINNIYHSKIAKLKRVIKSESKKR